MRFAFIGLLLLAGCGVSPDDAAYQRGEIVRMCRDGTAVVFDRVSGRFVAGKTSWDRTLRFFVRDGVRPQDVCDVR